MPPGEKASLTLEEKIATGITRQPLSLAIEGRNDAARSFAELDSCAKLLAAHLRTEDSAETGRVVICLTCVPLDPRSSAAWLAGKIAALDANIVLCDSIATPSFASLTRKLIILDQTCDVITATSIGEIPPIAKTQPAFCVVGTEVDEAPAVRTLSSELLLESLSLGDNRRDGRLRGNSAFGNARRSQHHSAGRGRTRRDTKKCEACTSASDVCAMAQLDNGIREKGPVFPARFAMCASSRTLWHLPSIDSGRRSTTARPERSSFPARCDFPV